MNPQRQRPAALIAQLEAEIVALEAASIPVRDMERLTGLPRSTLDSLRRKLRAAGRIAKNAAGRFQDRAAPDLPAASAAKTRACLRCRAPFKSSGPGERICKPCKQSPEWRWGEP